MPRFVLVRFPNHNPSASPPYTPCSLPRHPYSHSQEGISPATQIFLARKEGRDQTAPQDNFRVSLPTLLQVCHMPLPHYKALPDLCLLSSPSLPLTEWSWAPAPPPGSLHLSLPGLHGGGGTVMLPLPAVGCLRGLPCLPFWILSRVLSPFLPPHVPGPRGISLSPAHPSLVSAHLRMPPLGHCSCFWLTLSFPSLPPLSTPPPHTHPSLLLSLQVWALTLSCPIFFSFSHLLLSTPHSSLVSCSFVAPALTSVSLFVLLLPSYK